MSVKDVVTSLVDDGLVDSEKIGSCQGDIGRVADTVCCRD